MPGASWPVAHAMLSHSCSAHDAVFCEVRLLLRLAYALVLTACQYEAAVELLNLLSHLIFVVPYVRVKVREVVAVHCLNLGERAQTS